MKVTGTAQNRAKQFEEAHWSRKQYLDTARGHYLSALAGLSGGKKELTKISHSSDSSLLVEDNAINQEAQAERASTPEELEQAKTFTGIGVQMQLPNRVLKASENDLQAVKLQLHKNLARNCKSQITEMICKLKSIRKELDINDAADLKSTTIASLESDDAKESLPKKMVESSSLHRMVESLKAELENWKKEHAELDGIDAGAEFAARNSHFRLFKSKPENGGCLEMRNKTRQTSEEVTQDKDEANDLKIKSKGLKWEHGATKFCKEVEKRPRIVLDVDEAKGGTESALDQAKSFPEGIYPLSVSTSESSARIMISEDELESSGQQVGNSARLERGTSVARTEGNESEKCDYASEFSIRDFVFSARNKDISLNWPFSQKNLQLCMKHGVKDVLPPFQPMESLRDSSMKRCLAERSLHSEESNLDGKQPMLKNHLVPGTTLEMDHSWNQDLAEGYRDSDLFPTGGDRGLAFKTLVTANSQSEVGSVSTSNLPLSEVSDEREAVGSAAINKRNSSTSQVSNKKCKVTMKMHINSKRNTPEDITSACTLPPETISSKICPVCENFSSSSNTTLNAHIDQCLTSQSPPIWMKSSKLIKPRIKPRKIRLMTDICATAPGCTLEDLDRRNGTNWATNVDFPLEDAEVPVERRISGVSSRYLINNVDDASVYIDSSGRKIRILSKFNDTPPPSFSKAREDLRPRKQSIKGKRSKFFSPNRKKHLAKHLKYLKVSRQRKRSFSLKVKGRSTEACETEEAMVAVGDTHIEQQQSASSDKGLKAQEENHPGVAGTSSRWKSLKISNLLKNSDSEASTKLSRCDVQAAKDLVIGNDQVGTAQLEPRRTPVKKHFNFPKRSLSSKQRNLRTPVIYPAGVGQRSEASFKGKTLGGRSLRGAVRGKIEASQIPLNLGTDQFEGGIAKESTPKISDSPTVPAPGGERKVDIQPNALQVADISVPTSMKLLRSCQIGLSEGRRLRNKTNMLSPNRSGFRACQANSDIMGSALEDSCDCSGNEETEAWSADIIQQSGAKIDRPKSSRLSDFLGRPSTVKVRQKQALEHGQDGQKDTNRSDQLSDDTHGNYSCVRSAMKGLHNDKDLIASVSSSSFAIGVNETSVRTVLDSEVETIADISPQSELLHCSDKFQGPIFGAESSSQPGLNDPHEMFYGRVADAERLELKTGDYILNFGHGSFPEVDPIPIPGPPGSDLPSFSDMGSEDLHKISPSKPSRDGDDVVDKDLSESLLSATSTISSLVRTDDFTFNDQESLSASLSVPDIVNPGWLGASSGPLPGMSTVSSQFSAAACERVTCVTSSEKGMNNLEGGPATLNHDNQQSRCSKQSECTQSTMNSTESQLLGWRPTTYQNLSGGKHTYSTLDGLSNDLEDRSAVFSSSSYQRVESANFSHFVETSQQSLTSLETTAEAADPFLRSGDYDSAYPSAPILRLMGKDLMVSNRMDADLSGSRVAINVGMNRLVHPVTEITFRVNRSWNPPSSQTPGFMEPRSSQSPAFVETLHGQDPHILSARPFDDGSSNVIQGFEGHNRALEDAYINERMRGSFSVLGAAPLQR